MHKMAGSQYQRHRQPEISKAQRNAQCRLIEEENDRYDWKRRAAHPMRLGGFEQVFCRSRGVHRVRVIRVAIRLCGEQQASASTALNMYDKFSISATGNRLGRKSHTISSPSSTAVISHPR